MKSCVSRNCLIAVLILGLLLVAALPSGAGQGISISPALRAIMDQVEQTYLARNGISFHIMVNKDPVAAARLLGIGMIPQVDYSKQSQSNRRRYLGMIQEIKGFLAGVARAHQNGPNGLRNITYDQLWNAFGQGFTGKSNQWAIARFGVNPFAVRQPSVLYLANDPGITVREPRADIPMGERNEGAVNLFGRPADRVQGGERQTPSVPPPVQSQESKYRWKVLGIFQNPTWWSGSYKEYSPFGNPEKPVVSNITECCDSTRGCPGRNNVKVVPCSAVRGNCVMKVQLLKDSYLGRKGEIKCILQY